MALYHYFMKLPSIDTIYMYSCMINTYQKGNTLCGGFVYILPILLLFQGILGLNASQASVATVPTLPPPQPALAPNAGSFGPFQSQPPSSALSGSLSNDLLGGVDWGSGAAKPGTQPISGQPPAYNRNVSGSGGLTGLTSGRLMLLLCQILPMPLFLNQ